MESYRRKYTRFLVAITVAALGGLAAKSVSAGDPVPGIDVSLEQIPGGIKVNVKTGKDGKFTFENLRPGTYVLNLPQAAENHNTSRSNKGQLARPAEVWNKMSMPERERFPLVLVGKLRIKSRAAVRADAATVPAKLVLRDKLSKAIIATTTADKAGDFKFVGTAINAGRATALEIGVELPGVTHSFCFLPADPAPGIDLLPECDPGGPVELRVGWTCFNPPCPWEVENWAVSITLFQTGQKKPFEPIQVTIGPKGGRIIGDVVSVRHVPRDITEPLRK